MSLPNIHIQCFEHHKDIATLESVWNELHRNCTAPSIYNGFDFNYESIKSFTDKAVTAKVFTLTDTSSGQLLAIFPMQHISFIWRIFKINSYEYTALDEVDKPYPVIREGYLEICWNEFLKHLKNNVADWDHLQLIEMPESNIELNLLPKICIEHDLMYRVANNKQGPIIDLQGDWGEYWSQHKKMRKKIRKMTKDFADRLEFKVYRDDWGWCLEQYMSLEQKSWKGGKIGISKNQRNKTFYRNLFERLDAADELQFGFLSIDGELVSGEIAYTKNDTVYFSHGCYDQVYNKYSPGMVSTSFFIKHFYGGTYRKGDFLCGYASYLEDWSDSLVKTHRIDIYNKRLKIRAIFGARILRKIFVFPALKVFKVVYAKFK